MDKAKFGELLEMAGRQLAEVQRVIDRQQSLISRMLEEGAETAEVQSLVEKLQASAAAMARYQRDIEQQMQAFKENSD